MTVVCGFYDLSGGTAVLTDSANILATSLGEGIAWDGEKLWVADDTSDTITAHRWDGSAFVQVQSFSMGSQWTQPNGLAFDGQNIVIGCQELVTGPPISEPPTYLKMDPTTGALVQMRRMLAAEGVGRDLTFDGQNLLRTTGGSGSVQWLDGEQVRILDTGSSTGRTLAGIACWGNSFVVLCAIIGANRFLFSYDPKTATLLQNHGSIGTKNVVGMTFMGNPWGGNQNMGGNIDDHMGLLAVLWNV